MNHFKFIFYSPEQARHLVLIKQFDRTSREIEGLKKKITAAAVATMNNSFNEH